MSFLIFLSTFNYDEMNKCDRKTNTYYLVAYFYMQVYKYVFICIADLRLVIVVSYLCPNQVNLTRRLPKTRALRVVWGRYRRDIDVDLKIHLKIELDIKLKKRKNSSVHTR